MSIKRSFFPLLSFILFLLPISISAYQNEVTNSLATPQKAVHTFLHWQQTGHTDLVKAASTMKIHGGSLDERIELATELKNVLDARGLLVEYDAIPNTKNFVDSLSGLQQYILFDELPEVYLIKKNNEWIFSEATINQIPLLYRETFSSLVEAVIGELPDSLKQDWFGIQLWQYIAVFIWLLFGLILRKIFEFILDNYIHRLAKKTKFTWDDDLIDGIDKPSGFIFMMFFWLATFTNLQLSVTVNHYLSLVLEIAVSVGFIWLFYNLSDVFSKYLGVLTSKTETKLDDQLVPLIRKTLRFFVLVMGAILILQNNGYNVASLIAGLGIGGLAVALAARDTLANFFGSVTIFVDKPFRIGDWIKVAGVEGTVEEVGFRSTRIRTFYNSLVSVPNSNISNNEVDNLGLREYRRLRTTLNLTYSTTPEQMEAFVEGIKAIVKSNSHFRQDFYEVHFNAFGAHSLDVMIYVFFKVPDWSTELQQKHNFFLEILKLAQEVGVEFAFPTQTLHVDSFHKDEPRQVGELKSEEELAARVIEFGPNGTKSNPDGLRIFKDGKEVDFGSGK
ncbi:MAG TPA: mechanosensitive ion channel family protein [Balneola sp.]|jgi:MscS family membrane protein|nr:hypothetical protein [Balneola sp.]MAO76458.1 hypothetical protein [Balneola sp.]MBF65649.1 hypothetical protein [Balneola sp.]HAH50104.1 mechanosensitive ion channel family protein [Balneola sp.]HAW80582.1 mechanosensitive ion channel family protein [Balneola sp.]|tara:strand:- start:142511 stop:144193 length:1683 start_codon:yes stop_codon:yes gene_type:complete